MNRLRGRGAERLGTDEATRSDGTRQIEGEGSMYELTVMNPVARLTAVASGSGGTASTAAPRLSRLSGATIGLWWNLKIGGEVALEWLGDSLASSDSASVAPFYGRYPASAEMVAAAAEQSQAVIGATAD